MRKLWIAGGLSVGLVALLTYLGGQSSGRPVGRFYLYIAVLALLMVQVGKGRTWARWIVSAVLLFFAGVALMAGGVEGVVVSALFLLSAGVFFRHRPEVREGSATMEAARAVQGDAGGVR